MDNALLIVEIGVAAGTWAIALATVWLVKGHLSTADEQRKILLSTADEQRQILLSTAEEQRQIQLYLELRREFDSSSLRSARKLFAEQILDGKPHDEMKQEILTFFEDVGMLVRRKYLDREMVWDTFGHFAKMWWSACREYIAREQSYMGSDPFFFGDFKYLVEQIYEDDVRKRLKPRADLEPSPSAVESFLATEAQRPRGFNLKVA
jgi:hypothetical protein